MRVREFKRHPILVFRGRLTAEASIARRVTGSRMRRVALASRQAGINDHNPADSRVCRRLRGEEKSSGKFRIVGWDEIRDAKIFPRSWYDARDRHGPCG